MQWVYHGYSRFEAVWSTASRRKKAGVYICVYTGLFLLAFLLAYSPFLLGGKTLVWKSDGRNTHYPTLVYVGRYLRQVVLNLLHGKPAIPLFDLSLGMGSDIIATLNYYGFGDPLYLLSAFVPAKYSEYLYNFLAIFRMYLSGLTFSVLCVYHKKRISYALIGALTYVFSGYAIFSAVRHPYFISPMIQLPLLLVGADQIIRRKKPFLFILTVFYSALCGFYFLYMMTIMVGIYALVRFFECYSSRRIREFAGMAGRIIQNYILGVGMAAALFIPAVIGFLSSSRSGIYAKRNLFFYGWKYYYGNLLGMIAPPASWNSLALAAITLPALILLFSARKKEQRSLRRLFAAAMCFLLLPLGGYIMNGFGYPSNRWSFGFALLLSYILVEMMPVLLQLNAKEKRICFSALLIYAFCVFAAARSRSVYYVVGTAMLGITLAALLLLNGPAGKEKELPKAPKKAGAAICVFLVVWNVSVNALYKFSADQGNYINDFAELGAESSRLIQSPEREAGPYISQRDGRLDAIRSLGVNTGAVWHIPTLYSSWSIGNSYMHDFWEQTENIAVPHASARFDGADHRTITEALFSVKYFIGKEAYQSYLPYGYKAGEKTENGYTMYENQYALPFGYTYGSCIPYEDLDGLNGLETEEAMLQSIVLEQGADHVQRGEIESRIETIPFKVAKMSNLKWENGVLQVKKANAVMTLEFLIPAQREGYLRLQKFDINDSGQTSFNVTAKCGDVSKSAAATSTAYTWYFGRENYLFNLGYSEEARTTCTITFPKKGTYRLEDIALYALPMDKFPEQVEALRAESLENIAFGTNRITGTVDLSDSKILCMSVPYSKGWSAKVDGAKAEILRGNIMFMALPLPAGHHEIELRYCTPGLRPGIVLSILSFGVVTAAYIRRRKSPG